MKTKQEKTLAGAVKAIGAYKPTALPEQPKQTPPIKELKRKWKISR